MLPIRAVLHIPTSSSVETKNGEEENHREDGKWRSCTIPTWNKSATLLPIGHFYVAWYVFYVNRQQCCRFKKYLEYIGRSFGCARETSHNLLGRRSKREDYLHPQNIKGVNFSDRHVPPLGCLHIMVMEMERSKRNYLPLTVFCVQLESSRWSVHSSFSFYLAWKFFVTCSQMIFHDVVYKYCLIKC